MLRVRNEICLYISVHISRYLGMTKHLILLLFPFILGAQVAEFEVYFPFDDDRLGQSEKEKLDREIFSIPKSKIDSIHIFGHCDSLGTDEYNLELSSRRVIAVKRYLISRGFELNQLVSNYYGRLQPKYFDDEKFDLNRRCEIIVYHQPNIPFYSTLRVTDLELKKGESYVMPNLHFVGNQIVPMWYAFDVLSDLVTIFYKYPSLKADIQGHVCCVNDKPLSDERAQFVYEFLIQHGIHKNRLTYKGYGNLRPLIKETTAEEELQNRRVELKIQEIDEAPINLPEDFIPPSEVSMPLRGIDFIPNKAGLYPSGRFMLKLLAESIADSRGVHHNILINTNGIPEKLADARLSEISRQMKTFGCREHQFSVSPIQPRQMGRVKQPDLFVKISRL